MEELPSRSLRGRRCPPHSMPFSLPSSWLEPSSVQSQLFSRLFLVRCHSPPSSEARCLHLPRMPEQGKVQASCQHLSLAQIPDRLPDPCSLCSAQTRLCCSPSGCFQSHSAPPLQHRHFRSVASALSGEGEAPVKTGKTSQKSSSPCNLSQAGRTSQPGRRRRPQEEDWEVELVVG